MPANTPLIANVRTLRATWKPRPVPGSALEGGDQRPVFAWITAS